jgi:hypothetical protein
MSTKKRLTDRLLKSNSIIPDEDTKRTTIWDEKVTGFGIRVSHTGTISFFVRYRVFGKNRRYTIGKYPQISLSDARRDALDIKRKAMDDIDPARNKQDNCYSDTSINDSRCSGKSMPRRNWLSPRGISTG